METFYRVHWSDAPEFSAANAWSALWGAERSQDGSQTKCRACDGDGKYDGEPCEDCDGDGWIDCVRGYSSCWDAESLIAYFTEHGEPSGEQVIIFEGRHTANGFDGEPCAVPSAVIETITWEEFIARHA